VKLRDEIRKNLLAEIYSAEKARAQKLVKDPLMVDWVREFRKKYIADGFLMPLYAGDGAWSRSRARIEKYGDFILPWERRGEVIQRETPAERIQPESLLFWDFLASGQRVVFPKKLSKLPKHIRLRKMPARLVWRALARITKKMKCFGENGGGILLSPQDLDAEILDQVRGHDLWRDGEDGYPEPYRRLNKTLWMNKFHIYDGAEDHEQVIEMRPAWFHIASHAFFNTPLHRLPVFTALFTEKGGLTGVKFLDEDLSNPVRALIMKLLAKIPAEMPDFLDVTAQEREQRNMTWWLWKNVWDQRRKCTLSHGEIAQRTGEQRSKVSSAIKSFDDKLRNNLTNKLLQRLLLAAGGLHLDYNLTYNTLADHGLVPHRERELDSFDMLDELI